jgi:parallel beta-helix repeat protein
MVVTGEQNEISNNTISHNSNGLVLASPGSTVENNTIFDNFGSPGSRGIGIVILGSDADVEITHNTIFGNDDGAIFGVTSATVRDNSFDTVPESVNTGSVNTESVNVNTENVNTESVSTE